MYKVKISVPASRLFDRVCLAFVRHRSLDRDPCQTGLGIRILSPASSKAFLASRGSLRKPGRLI